MPTELLLRFPHVFNDNFVLSMGVRKLMKEKIQKAMEIRNEFANEGDVIDVEGTVLDGEESKGTKGALTFNGK